MSTLSPEPYSGTDVLEVMSEAKNYNRYLMSLVERHMTPGSKVVDFGAGTGAFALPLIHGGADLICVEPDPDLGVQLRNAGAKLADGLDEITRESIDFVYTFNVLEHIADDAATVHTLAAKLKPCGTLLVYVPAFQLLYSSFDRKIGHLRRYRRRNLAELVEAAGLQVITLRYADSAGFVIAVLYRLFGRADGKINRAALRLYDRVIFPVSLVLDTILYRWLGKNVILVARKSLLGAKAQHRTRD
jgi:SAM-dependent methyltransferase